MIEARELAWGRIVTYTQAIARWRPRLRDADNRASGDDELVPIAFRVLIVDVADERILIDAGLDAASSAWGTRFASEWSDVRWLSSWDEVEVTPTRVVLTHAHLDHVVGLTRDVAPALVPRWHVPVHVDAADREFARYDGKRDPDVVERLAVIERAGLLQLETSQDRELVSGVRYVAAPGESRGHRVVAIGRDVIVLGDLFHAPEELACLDHHPAGRDGVALRRSREHWLARAADTGALCFIGHAMTAPWGRVSRTARGWRWTPA